VTGVTEDYDGDSWEDYSSQFMFPGDGPECTCDHETVDHGYGGCDADGCPCEARWEHT
jgi:hypothetical protein